MPPANYAGLIFSKLMYIIMIWKKRSDTLENILYFYYKRINKWIKQQMYDFKRIKTINEIQASSVSFVEINFSRIQPKRFTFIIQELPFLIHKFQIYTFFITWPISFYKNFMKTILALYSEYISKRKA